MAARSSLLALTAFVAALAAGCGAGAQAPAAHPLSQRIWVGNAERFVATLNSDIGLTVGGGPTIADARHAMAASNGVYTMLVAYGLFGDCGPALADVGPPGEQARAAVATLVSVCTRLEHAAALFQLAMTNARPKDLLAATRASLAAEPLLVRAQAELAALGPA